MITIYLYRFHFQIKIINTTLKRVLIINHNKLNHNNIKKDKHL
jgi:hypothetical protein